MKAKLIILAVVWAWSSLAVVLVYLWSQRTNNGKLDTNDALAVCAILCVGPLAFCYAVLAAVCMGIRKYGGRG